MNTIQVRGVVRNGRVEVDEPLPLPDAAAVVVRGWDASADTPPSSDDVAATLRAIDAVEPMDWTPDELAAWEADRRTRREHEKAVFTARSEVLRGVWEGSDTCSTPARPGTS